MVNNNSMQGTAIEGGPQLPIKDVPSSDCMKQLIEKRGDPMFVYRVSTAGDGHSDNSDEMNVMISDDEDFAEY